MKIRIATGAAKVNARQFSDGNAARFDSFQFQIFQKKKIICNTRRQSAAF
jgi:hypothetical protein